MVMILNDNINTTDIIILSFELNKFSHILTHRTISNDNKINVFEIHTHSKAATVLFKNSFRVVIIIGIFKFSNKIFDRLSVKPS